MSDNPRVTDPEFFAQKYARLRSRAARAVETEVLGHAVGLNGFTTTRQARALAALLDLRSADRLLDVGTGRGWPGSLLAGVSGCELTATDVPVNALIDARESLENADLQRPARLVAADVLKLPFRSARFDAVTHADVFC